MAEIPFTLPDFVNEATGLLPGDFSSVLENGGQGAMDAIHDAITGGMGNVDLSGLGGLSDLTGSSGLGDLLPGVSGSSGSTVDMLFGGSGSGGVSIGGISFHATLDENHARKSKIAEHPVEGGSVMSDHIYNEQPTLTLKVMVTDSPINGDAGDHVQSIFDTVEALWEKREPVTVVSGLKVYENMAIESYSFPKKRESATEISFNLKQIIITESQSVMMSEGAQAKADAISSGDTATGKDTAKQPDKKLTTNNVRKPQRNANGQNAGRSITQRKDANAAYAKLGTGGLGESSLNKMPPKTTGAMNIKASIKK
jgi:hypothetical protein